MLLQFQPRNKKQKKIKNSGNKFEQINACVRNVQHHCFALCRHHFFLLFTSTFFFSKLMNAIEFAKFHPVQMPYFFWGLTWHTTELVWCLWDVKWCYMINILDNCDVLWICLGEVETVIRGLGRVAFKSNFHDFMQNFTNVNGSCMSKWTLFGA